MKAPEFFRIEEKGRAADGRRLAAKAILIQAAIVLILTLPALGLSIVSGNTALTHLMAAGSLLTLLILLFGLWAFVKARVWAALVFSLFCIFDLFSSFTLFEETLPEAVVAMANGILAFVTLCGLFIWLKNRPAKELQA